MSGSLLRVEVVDVDDRVVVAMVGDLDISTVPRLRDQLTDLLVAGRSHLIVDLDGVERIDDIGIGILVGSAWRTRSRGGSFTVVCSSAPILDVLEVSGVDRAVEVYPTLAAARAAGP